MDFIIQLEVLHLPDIVLVSELARHQESPVSLSWGTLEFGYNHCGSVQPTLS